MKIHFYTLEEIQNESDPGKLLAMALHNWGSATLTDAPEDFAEGIVILGEKLSVVPTLENFFLLAQKEK